MRKILFYYLLLFTVFIAFYLIYSFSIIQGDVFIYPLDDVYIHLSIARNFAESGFWSVNPGSFDSASSSILYTLLLSSMIYIFGDQVYHPLIINILAGYGAVFWIYKFFEDFYSERALYLGMSVSLLSLLYLMVVVGMEQTLHMLLCVMALYYIKKNINSGYSKNDFLKLLIVILLLGMVRFESMFFVTALSGVLLINRKIKESVLILIAGFLPIVIFGLISMDRGGFFFPNSVLVKGNYPDGNLFLSLWMIFKKGILTNLSFYKLFLFPFVCFGIYLYDKYSRREIADIFKNEILIIVVVATAILQSLFGLIRHRYENYLVLMLFIVAISVSGKYLKLPKGFSFKNNFRQTIFLGSLALFGIVGVYLVAYFQPVMQVSSKNIQEQQVEMSRFLHDHYKGQKIVANDIGAISYFSNVELLDILGLGSTDVTRFFVDNKALDQNQLNIKFHTFLADYIRDHQYKIAAIYPEWFPNEPPKDWIAVASWTIDHNRATARNRIVWYAFDKNEADKLRLNISKFKLNKNVKEEILYKK